MARRKRGGKMKSKNTMIDSPYSPAMAGGRGKKRKGKSRK